MRYILRINIFGGEKYMSSQVVIIAISALPEQAEEIEKAWKNTDGCVNRSQFVKKAINAYVGKRIFEERMPRSGSNSG